MLLLDSMSGQHTGLEPARAHMETEPTEICISWPIPENAKTRFHSSSGGHPVSFSLSPSLSLPSAHCVPYCEEVASQSR